MGTNDAAEEHVDAAEEHVLAVPTALFHSIGLFQGFSGEVDRYLPTLLDSNSLRFLPRSAAENDPSWKQLIPYVVLRHSNLVFHYARGGAGTEARLHSRRSIGIGGHVCADDGIATAEAYWQGFRRELAEEVQIDSPFTEQIIGLVNDDSLQVGTVHLGIIHVLDLAEPNVRLLDPRLTGGGFANLERLRSARDGFETWSQFVLDELK